MSWTAPTTHTDGSVIIDLAGYRIYYGTASGNYTGSINVVGKNSTSMPVTTLVSTVPAPGTYYIVVTAYDSSGIESNYSNEITVNL
jgi:fibronectin type 3 domain-containing protein